MTIEQAINKTLKIVDSETEGKDIFWGIPIASELQKLDCRLLIQWCGKCIQIYLSEFENSKCQELEQYLIKALNSWDSYTSSECIAISQKIWYLKGGRDEVQTSLSHLWAIVRDCKENDVSILSVCLVVSLLLPELSNRYLLNRYLEAATIVYQNYKKDQSDRTE